MDTTDNQTNEKLAGIIRPFFTIPSNSFKGYLTLATALGILGGAGAGTIASHIKSKNDKVVALDRKKKFYDQKVEEMENENWLNEIMLTKKKLESSRLSDEERSALEKRYIKLLNR